MQARAPASSPPVPAAFADAHFTPRLQGAQSRWGEPLPDFLVQLVFVQRLAADARARAGSVCRAWAHALLRGADAWRCWTALDLSRYSGATCPVSVAALQGAAALARGRLQELDVRDHYGPDRPLLTLDALTRVLRDNKQHLRQLAVGGLVDGYCMGLPTLRALVGAAGPALQALQVESVACEGDDCDLLPLLRAEPPFRPVRIESMLLDFSAAPPPERGAAAEMRPIAAAVATAAVRVLYVSSMYHLDAPALELLADALLAPTCRVQQLSLADCVELPTESLPAVARLLAGGDALRGVHLQDCPNLFNGASDAGVAAVCAALRRSTLASVRLFGAGLDTAQCEALREAAQRLQHVIIDVEPDIHAEMEAEDAEDAEDAD